MPGSVPELCRELGSPWSVGQGWGQGGGCAEGAAAQRRDQEAGQTCMAGWGSECSAGRGAYTGCLSHMLEEPLGRDEEPEQAAEPVPLVACLQQPEHLAQHRGGRGFEGRVESLECALHRCVQRSGVLRDESVTGGESGPAMGCCHPRSPCPPSCHRTTMALLVPVPPTLATSPASNLLGLETGEGLGAERTEHVAVPSVGLWFREPGVSPKRSCGPARNTAVRRRRSRGAQPSQTESMGMHQAQLQDAADGRKDRRLKMD